MKGRLYGPEALRGLAALIVAYNHAAFIAEQYGGIAGYFARSYLAVDLFFLLSGYILARTYEGRMPGTFAFTRMRFVRLWPPLAAGFLIGAVGAMLKGVYFTDLAAGLVTGVFMVPLWGFEFFLNRPAWSIFFEIVANALHALLLQRLPNWALAVFVALCAAVLAAGATEGLDVGQADRFWLGFPRVFLSYTLGILIYRINRDRARVPGWAGWIAVLAVPILIHLCRPYLPREAELAFVLIVNPLVLLASLSIGRSRIAAGLGGMSYSLYAMHFPILAIVIGLGMHWVPALASAIALSLAIGAIVDTRWRATAFELLGIRRRVAAANLAGA